MSGETASYLQGKRGGTTPSFSHRRAPAIPRSCAAHKQKTDSRKMGCASSSNTSKPGAKPEERPPRNPNLARAREFPKIADTKSKIVQLEGEQEYTYCRCGLSQNQPWCDGSHERENTGITPMCFTAEATEKRPLCMCKRSKGMPFCDGSHRSLDPVDIEDLLVDPTWVCVNGKTLPPVPEPPAEDAPAAAESAPVQVEAQPDQAEDKQ
eukprot:1329208-Rhodomonas_salina.2